MQKIITLLAFALISLSNLSMSPADTPQATIEAIASKDLLAVGYVDLKTVDLGACLDWANQQNLVPPDIAPQVMALTGAADEFLRQAKNAGADHVFALVRQEDLNLNGRPLFVVSVADGHDANETLKSLRQSLGLLAIPNFEMEAWNNMVLGGTANQIAQAKTKPVVERPDFANAWKKFGGRDAGLMIFGNSDTRRVVRELWPSLDAPFENITGKLIADSLTSGGLSLDLPADLGAKVTLQTTDTASANVFRNAVNELKKIGLASDGKYAAMIPPNVAGALAAIGPEVSGNEVVLDLGPVLNDKAQLNGLLQPILSDSQPDQRENKMRQIMLAMHNFESAYQSFPAYAIVDKDEKPLLSWRVQILPFLEHTELYNKFKLDEPWDSPHNIKLVNEMPVLFADHSQELAELNKAGKTRFVVPFGERCIFSGAQGAKLGQITDGTSNTVAVVNVVPDAAVIWTKPVDWNVDLKAPKKGLFNEAHTTAHIARADASVTLVTSDIDSKQLKGLLTKDGGETP